MNSQTCKCGKYEVEYISILYNCPKNKRFCCLACKTDNYINQETFIAIFQKDAIELIQERQQQIVYIFNEFKQTQYYKQFVSNQQQDEFNGLFEGMLTQQESLNQIQDITFQEIFDKIIEEKDFLNLSEKEIQFILMIKFLSHDNQQLAQILYQLENIQMLQYSSLLINLRLIVKKSNNITVFNKNFKPTKGLVLAQLIYAEDDLLCWTNFNYRTLQQQLQMQKINDKSSYEEINMTVDIKDVLIVMDFIFFSVLIDHLYLYQFIEYHRVKNNKKQKSFLFRFNQEKQCYFKMISKHMVILNQYDQGKIILFCLRNKKIISIIQKTSELFNYIKISNLFVVIENRQLNFYNFITKKLKNKINSQWLEGKCQFIPSKCELITFTNRLVVQKINYQRQSCCVIKSFDNVLSYVQNKQHNYLILLTHYNEIIIYDKNYVLIKRIKWQKFLFSSHSEFIVNKNMKYIFIRRHNYQEQSKLKIYRCQLIQ